MRIGIDMRALAQGRSSGVEEYVKQLLSAVFSIDHTNEYILFFNAWKNVQPDLRWVEEFPNVSVRRFHIPNKLLNFFLWYAHFPKLDKLMGGVDIFFMPNINFGRVSSRAKFLLTVHDLSFEHYAQTFSLKRRAWHFFVNPKALCTAADGIIAVSDATHDDLQETYGISANKVSTIHSAVPARYRVIDRNDISLFSVREKYNVPYKFILSLSTIEPRKNIVSIIRAYAALRDRGQKELAQYKLVIAGERGWKWRAIEEEIVRSPYSEDILRIGFIADEDKPALYNLASLFVYPSFYEGFGFPPLEAMQCGTPVITSNASSLPEIVGDAAIMIDPDRPDELYRAMKEILLNQNLHTHLRTKGMERARQFSWHKSAEQFLALVEKMKSESTA